MTSAFFCSGVVKFATILRFPFPERLVQQQESKNEFRLISPEIKIKKNIRAISEAVADRPTLPIGHTDSG